MASIYEAQYARSLDAPDAFWAAAAEDIHWQRRWDQVLDRARPPFYRWFAGGRMNTCYNALDLHVDRGRGKQLALIYDSPVTGTVRTYTYAELRDEVARFAGALRRLGVERGRPGDHLHADGARGGDGDAGLRAHRRGPLGRVRRLRRERARQAHRRRAAEGDPVGVVRHRGRTASIPYKPLLDGAIELAAHKPERCVILQRPQERATLGAGRDVDWSEVAGGRAGRGVRAASRRPIRSTSSTPRARPGSPRASCATTAATPWRSGGA